mgnify:CR=1 FL=1
MFYSAFYLMCQIGFLIGYGTELIAIQIIEPMRPWVIMLPIPATIATILAIVGRLSTIKLFVVALCLRPRFWFIQPVPCKGPVIDGESQGLFESVFDSECGVSLYKFGGLQTSLRL